MNEILKKRIEEAAGKCSFKYLSQDRIEELELGCHYEAGFIAGAEYTLSHQWISIEEALPKTGELVLVKHKPIASTHYYQDDMSIAYIQNQGTYGIRWIINGMSWKINRDNIDDNTVTHWMPIPKFNPDKTE